MNSSLFSPIVFPSISFPFKMSASVFASSIAVSALLLSISAAAQTASPTIEQRLQALEKRLHVAEQEAADARARYEDLQVEISQQSNQQSASAFNPAIGVILNGKAVHKQHSGEAFSIPGIWLPDESGYGDDGLQLGESELNLSSNVDDKFYGAITIAFGDGAEVEEAYLQTLALPAGFNIKVGRFFSNIGYLTNRHTHTDDFAQRPLAYQAFLGGQYGDDGLQLNWLAPTDLFWESGIEVFRGDAYPAEGAGHRGVGSWTAYSHIGGDLGFSHSWRAGLSYLSARVEGRQGNADERFSGDSELWIIDGIWKWAPDGNSTVHNAKLQAEYIQRNEKGDFSNDSLSLQSVDSDQSGWYVQGVYQFMPRWRIGLRYEQMDLDDVSIQLQGTTLDASGYKPKASSLMLDWTNSEFSRLRLQLTDDQSSPDSNTLLTLQYIAAFGAHGAHSF